MHFILPHQSGTAQHWSIAAAVPFLRGPYELPPQAGVITSLGLCHPWWPNQRRYNWASRPITPSSTYKIRKLDRCPVTWKLKLNLESLHIVNNFASADRIRCVWTMMLTDVRICSCPDHLLRHTHITPPPPHLLSSKRTSSRPSYPPPPITIWHCLTTLSSWSTTLRHALQSSQREWRTALSMANNWPSCVLKKAAFSGRCPSFTWVLVRLMNVVLNWESSQYESVTSLGEQVIQELLALPLRSPITHTDLEPFLSPSWALLEPQCGPRDRTGPLYPRHVVWGDQGISSFFSFLFPPSSISSTDWISMKTMFSPWIWPYMPTGRKTHTHTHTHTLTHSLTHSLLEPFKVRCIGGLTCILNMHKYMHNRASTIIIVLFQNTLFRYCRGSLLHLLKS